MLDFWYEHFGRHLDPNVSPYRAFTQTYQSASGNGKMRLGGAASVETFTICGPNMKGPIAVLNVKLADPNAVVEMVEPKYEPRLAVLLNLLRNPPETPFLFVRYCPSPDRTLACMRITESQDKLELSGANPETWDRPALMRALDMTRDMPDKDLWAASRAMWERDLDVENADSIDERLNVLTEEYGGDILDSIPDFNTPTFKAFALLRRAEKGEKENAG